MKLSKEIPYVRERFSTLHGIKEYAAKLKASGNYKVFETRLAWDCVRMTIPTEIICGWYDKYNCNDDHITTLAKHILREMNII